MLTHMAIAIGCMHNGIVKEVERQNLVWVYRRMVCAQCSELCPSAIEGNIASEPQFHF